MSGHPTHSRIAGSSAVGWRGSRSDADEDHGDDGVASAAGRHVCVRLPMVSGGRIWAGRVGEAETGGTAGHAHRKWGFGEEGVGGEGDGDDTVVVLAGVVVEPVDAGPRSMRRTAASSSRRSSSPPGRSRPRSRRRPKSSMGSRVHDEVVKVNSDTRRPARRSRWYMATACHGHRRLEPSSGGRPRRRESRCRRVGRVARGWPATRRTGRPEPDADRVAVSSTTRPRSGRVRPGIDAHHDGPVLPEPGRAVVVGVDPGSKRDRSVVALCSIPRRGRASGSGRPVRRVAGHPRATRPTRRHRDSRRRGRPPLLGSSRR